MALEDKWIYELQSCDVGSYPSFPYKHTDINPSPFSGQIVTVGGLPSSQRYLLFSVGLNAAFTTGNLPPLATTALNACGDAIGDKLFDVFLCGDPKTQRRVQLPANYALGLVLRFTGEDTCWTILQEVSNFDENLTIATVYNSCIECVSAIANGSCDYEERTIGYAVKVALPKVTPPDRGFEECCVTALILADLSDTASYKNDFTSVFYQKQTASDTVVYKLIGAATGTTTLVDVTHGTLYPFGGTEQPNLSYFTVDWRKILNVLGEDSYIIRKETTIAGITFNVDTEINYNLKQFSVNLADTTVRIDCKLNGKLIKIDTDFKNTGYQNSLRLDGFFGNRKANFEQDNIVYSEKYGQPYYEDQITMSNDFEYLFKAYQVPKCVADLLYNEILWGNELFVSDYNKNNHSYDYDLTPVVLTDDNSPDYKAMSRLININLTFNDRLKNNRKTNC